MKRTKRINPISKKKRAQIAEEIQVKKKLAEHCGGVFVVTSWADGVETGGFCLGGRCEECGCYPEQSPPDFVLHPHHSGIGAKRKTLSLVDKMVCTKCGAKPHGIKVVYSKPQWSKGE